MSRSGGGFSLEHLLCWLAHGDEAALPDRPGAPFGAVTMSSRRDGVPPMREGGLFVAIRGARRDGHDFVADAFANGARAALVARVPEALQPAVAAGTVQVRDFRRGTAAGGADAQGHAWPMASDSTARAPLLLLVDDPLQALQQCAAWWRRRQRARVLAITGSVGKTTAKELLANILRRRYAVLSTEGNLNNELGLPIMLLRLTEAHEQAVLEIGISAVGEMATFAALARPDVAIVTRVAPVHLLGFGTVETVEREKGELVVALRDDGLAVLNADDERVARMHRRTRAQAIFYGCHRPADVRATEIEQPTLEGLGFRLHYGGRSERAWLPLVGQHFITPALAAAAAAFAEGCGWDEVLEGLAQPPQGARLQPRRLPNGAVVLDDTYNASPVATMAALDVLAALPGRRIAVLGDMLELGAFAIEGHRQVGERAARCVDELIAVGELAPVIVEAALAAGLPAARAAAVPGNAAAVARLRARLRAGDYVLIKGSHGVHMEEIVQALTESPPAAEAQEEQH